MHFDIVSSSFGCGSCARQPRHWEKASTLSCAMAHGAVPVLHGPEDFALPSSSEDTPPVHDSLNVTGLLPRPGLAVLPPPPTLPPRSRGRSVRQRPRRLPRKCPSSFCPTSVAAPGPDPHSVTAVFKPAFNPALRCRSASHQGLPWPTPKCESRFFP